MSFNRLCDETQRVEGNDNPLPGDDELFTIDLTGKNIKAGDVDKLDKFDIFHNPFMSERQQPAGDDDDVEPIEDKADFNPFQPSKSYQLSPIAENEEVQIETNVNRF